jgi:hypothetical protein
MIYYQWQGDAFKPMPRFAKECDRQFVIGQVYPLEVSMPRSRSSHNHQFAEIEEAWRNLPENVAEHFPTSEHLRKFALIRTGFRDERSIVCSSRAEALRIAAFMRPSDPLAWIVVGGSTVTVYTAKSQSVRAMGAKEFQRSKQAVLDYIAGMIGVSGETLSENAGRAA